MLGGAIVPNGDAKNDPVPVGEACAFFFSYSVSVIVAPDAGVAERNDPVPPDAGIADFCEDGVADDASPDSGATSPDSGATSPDSGATSPDSGLTTPDSGGADNASTSEGVPCASEGVPDAGVPDAGVPEISGVSKSKGEVFAVCAPTSDSAGDAVTCDPDPSDVGVANSDIIKAFTLQCVGKTWKQDNKKIEKVEIQHRHGNLG